MIGYQIFIGQHENKTACLALFVDPLRVDILGCDRHDSLEDALAALFDACPGAFLHLNLPAPIAVPEQFRPYVQVDISPLSCPLMRFVNRLAQASPTQFNLLRANERAIENLIRASLKVD